MSNKIKKDDIGLRLSKERKRRSISVPELGSILDIPKDRIYKWEQGVNFPKYEDRIRVENWINNPKYNDIVSEVITNDNSLAVPIYDIEFTLGFQEQIKQDSIPQVGQLAISEVQGCDFIVRARGDSMFDYICDRDWIGIKRIHDMDVIVYGHPYAVVTDELLIVKYLLKSDKGDKYWKLKSQNSFYEDFDIPKAKVKELYVVRAILPFSRIKSII